MRDGGWQGSASPTEETASALRFFLLPVALTPDPLPSGKGVQDY
jgi:hypothetical protein